MLAILQLRCAVWRRIVLLICSVALWHSASEHCSFVCHYIRARNLVSHQKGRTQITNFWEWVAEENVWNSQRANKRSRKMHKEELRNICCLLDVTRFSNEGEWGRRVTWRVRRRREVHSEHLLVNPNGRYHLGVHWNVTLKLIKRNNVWWIGLDWDPG
jgi:hypothetical protein